MWFADLPAAVCGWMMGAVKQAGDNPPAENGAGYNSARIHRNLFALNPLRNGCASCIIPRWFCPLWQMMP